MAMTNLNIRIEKEVKNAAEARALMKDQNTPSYNSVEELFNALDS